VRIGYFGDGPWSHRALDRILNINELEVVFIVARFESGDPVLRSYAERLDIPYYLHHDVNQESFIELIGKHDADIYVSMSFDQLIRKGIMDSVPKGFINCHAGALPYYRGRNTLNWALINGEKQFGVTVHHMDEGIDTGDIIIQRFAEISDDDDYASLLGKAVSLCAEILPEALLHIARGEERRVKQQSIDPVGFYCSRRKAGDEWIDWSDTSEKIHNFIRALTSPGPVARTIVKGRKLAVIRSELVDGAPVYMDKPGRVVGRCENGVIVKTGDTSIKITEVADLYDSDRICNKRAPVFTLGTFLGVDLLDLLHRLALGTSGIPRGTL
jgi:methionyl-tRNA formyltransferase